MTSFSVLAGKSGVRDQEQRRRAEPGDAGEILHRIERRVLGHQARDGVAVGGHHQRVAVRRGLGDGRGAGKARPVLDDDLLAPAPAHLLGEDARQDVGDGAGAERHDHRHALGRPALRRNRRRRNNASGRSWPPHRTQTQNPLHRIPPRLDHFASAAGRAGAFAFLSATSSSRLLPKSFSITAAALRPGPPEIEPPGCVVEPVW